MKAQISAWMVACWLQPQSESLVTDWNFPVDENHESLAENAASNSLDVECLDNLEENGHMVGGLAESLDNLAENGHTMGFLEEQRD